jgi:hypothetical protein
MKTADWFILKEIQQIQTMLVVQNEKLDKIIEGLALQAYVTPELETAINRVSVLAASIDRKVPDR